MFKIKKAVKKKIIKINFITFIFTLLFLFFSTPLYKSETSLYLISESKAPRSLSAIFGGVSSGMSAETILFFDLRDVAQSRMLKEKIFLSTWQNKDNQNITLKDFWELEVDENLTKELADNKILHRGVKRLDNRIITNYSLSTGLFKVSVIMEDPSVAQQIANEINNIILDYANNINQIKAQKELEFLNDKLNDKMQSLKKSEDNLKDFIQNNIDISSSPYLLVEKARLERAIKINDQIYQLILAEKETAEIKSQKSNVIITRLDYPNYPIRPFSPNYVSTVFVMMFLSISLSFVYFHFSDIKSFFIND